MENGHSNANPCSSILRILIMHSLQPSFINSRNHSLFINFLFISLAIFTPAAAAAKLLQSWPTLSDPIDGSPPGSPVPGILQARTLEWVAIYFSNSRSEKWKWSSSVVSDSEQPHGLQPTRFLRPWDSPGKGTGVGCHFLLRTFTSRNFFTK